MVRKLFLGNRKKKKSPKFSNPEFNRTSCLWHLSVNIRLISSGGLKRTGYPDLMKAAMWDLQVRVLTTFPVTWINFSAQKQDPGWDSLLSSKDRSQKPGLVGDGGPVPSLSLEQKGLPPPHGSVDFVDRPVVLSHLIMGLCPATSKIRGGARAICLCWAFLSPPNGPAVCELSVCSLATKWKNFSKRSPCDSLRLSAASWKSDGVIRRY